MDEVGDNHYTTFTFWDKLVSDYSNISIIEVQNLDLIDYLILKHDAFIDRLYKTEKGNEYLNNAWRLEFAKKPDRAKLKEYFGKEAHNNGK